MELNLCMGCMETLHAPGPCPYCGFDENTYVAPTHHLALSSILKGRYLMGKALEEGGFGITYLAWDLNQGTKVAVKEYFPYGYTKREHSHGNDVLMANGERGGFSRQGLEKFIEESQYLMHYRSLPGVVDTMDCFRENNTAYIVMELLQESLKQKLTRNGPIPTETLFPMMRPIMDALEEIHKANLIHRDISPDNILFDTRGQAKLIDFGAARVFDENGEKSLSVILKFRYAPPEQYQRHGHQGPWTDVYGLCATMYHAATGTVPTDAVNQMNGQAIKKPSELGIPIRPDYEAALMKGLSIRAQDRFQSMGELKKALFGQQPPAPSLGPAAQPSAPVPPTVNPQPAAPKPKRAFRLLWGAFAAASVFLTLFFLVSSLVMVHIRRSEKEGGPGATKAWEPSENGGNANESLASQPESPDALPPDSAEDDGNLFGNAHCYARMASDGTYLYFRNSLDDDRTYWIKKGETEEHLLTEVPMKDFHYKDGWIYYSGNSTISHPSDDRNIYRMRDDGTGITNLTNLAFDNPQSLLSFETMAGGKCFFYYSDGKGPMTDIGYVPENGGSPTFLAHIPDSNAPSKGFCLNVVGDKLYYLAKDGLHYVDIGTHADHMAIGSFSCDEYIIYGGVVYFSTTGALPYPHAKLERVNLDGTGRKALFTSPEVSNMDPSSIRLSINIYQGRAYLLMTANLPEIKTFGQLYSCSLDGNGCQMLLDDVSWFNIIDHVFYYRYVDMQNIGDERYRYAPYYYIPIPSLISGKGLESRKELFDVTPYK